MTNTYTSIDQLPISDFTTNLIKHYLLEVTQNFAKRHLDSSLCRKFTNIPRVTFDYKCGVWKAGSYYLPMGIDGFMMEGSQFAEKQTCTLCIS